MKLQNVLISTLGKKEDLSSIVIKLSDFGLAAESVALASPVSAVDTQRGYSDEHMRRIEDPRQPTRAEQLSETAKTRRWTPLLLQDHPSILTHALDQRYGSFSSVRAIATPHQLRLFLQRLHQSISLRTATSSLNPSNLVVRRRPVTPFPHLCRTLEPHP
ncbi:hypothetical protein K504DRAFT_497271 [Pleomassaria siparia CBS 279.74]|uniref:Protein kinase domain-containing protein n=1 Tax=Pleomassaria siparia CBS 279.74 TaxID=1314801 RepID=A0A6G1KSU7_9PLEO|nr:hypothetical protein K504DRAFT_497271 [Pleomassaria siparia CBS 279.74]